MFYSKSTGGFYDVEINGNNIPADAVEITREQHAALLAGQSSGKRIDSDKNGHPVLVVAPAPTEEQLAASARAKRDALLKSSDWVTLRAMETSTPVPPEWLTYRQKLRDVPAQKGFQKSIEWPKAPTL